MVRLQYGNHSESYPSTVGDFHGDCLTILRSLCLPCYSVVFGLGSSARFAMFCMCNSIVVIRTGYFLTSRRDSVPFLGDFLIMGFG